MKNDSRNAVPMLHTNRPGRQMNGKQVFMGLAVFMAAFVLSGCSVYQSKVDGVEIAMPGHYAEQEKAAAEQIEQKGVVVDKFWRYFNDERLNAIVDEALDNNLDIVQGYERLRQAEALVEIAASPRLPFVNINGRAGREKQLSFFGAGTGDSYSLSLEAGYEVDLWKKLANRDAAAEYNLLATREDLKTIYLGIAASVTDLYYVIIEQQAQLVLTDKIVATYKDRLERIEQRYEEGLIPALDVYQARENILQAKSQQPLYEAAIANATHALSVLLGRFPEADLLGKISRIPDIDERFSTGMPAAMLQRRPDIKSAFLLLQAQDAETAAAVADRFPSFNLLAGYGTAGIDYATSLTGTFWSIFVNATQPLFDAGRRKAEVRRNEALFRARAANYRQTVLEAVREVEDALSGIRAVEKRIALLQERLEASDSTLRLAEDRYFVGLSDYLPVLTAQQLNFQAQQELLAARKNLISEHISLLRALGGAWMDEQIAGFREKRMDKTGEGQ